MYLHLEKGGLVVEATQDGEFVEFEIQPVAMYISPGSDGKICEAFHDLEQANQVAEEYGGEVWWGVYGRYEDGRASHVADRVDYESARSLVYSITGVNLPPKSDSKVSITWNVASKTAVNATEGVSEVIADIAFNAGHKFAKGELSVTNSRDLMDRIIHWAEKFEAAFDKDVHGDDYIGLVDDFSRDVLSGDIEEADAFLEAMRASTRRPGIRR